MSDRVDRWPERAEDRERPWLVLPHRTPLLAEGRAALGNARAGPGSPDRWLGVVALLLVGLGIVMVYSASAIRAQERFGDPLFFLKRHAIAALLGLLAMAGVLRIDYRRLQRAAPVLYLLALLLLLLVLVPQVGIKVNGARRWLRVLGVSFQPVEFAKLALIVFLASYFSRRADRLDSFADGFLPPMILTGAFASLVILQPNFGTAAILLLAAAVLFFVGGARLSHLGLTLLVGVPALVLVMVTTPHARARLLALMDPGRASPEALYQMNQSLYALGPGGLVGRGLGDSMQKLFYLPEPHTDFIFAIFGEELGFLGTAVVVGLFALFLWRGTRIALGAPDAFGSHLAMGLTAAIVGQAAVNMGVVIGLLPTTGVPLPFLSYGGSALVFTLIGVGILLSISRQSGGGRGG